MPERDYKIMLANEDAIELEAELREFANIIGHIFLNVHFIRKCDTFERYTIGNMKPSIYTGIEILELVIELATFTPNIYYDQKIGKIIEPYGFVVGSCSASVDYNTIKLSIHAFQTKEPDDIL